MNFKSFYLLEKNFQDLYHFTALQNLLRILRENTMDAGQYGYSTKESGKVVRKVHNGVSFTRNKIADLKEIADINLQTRITVDGSSLSNNYKFIPRDEFKDRSESEELVNGSIKNVRKYIKEILIDSKKLTRDMFKEEPWTYIKLYLYTELVNLIPNFKENQRFKDIVEKLDNFSDEDGREDAVKDFIDLVIDGIKAKYNLKVSLKN